MTLTPITILLLLYGAFVTALTVAEYKSDSRAQWFLKPACALGFILIALQSGALESTYGQIILAALCLCAIGDVALLSRKSQNLFFLGMAAFAIGHLSYVISFLEHGMLFGAIKNQKPIGSPALITVGIIVLSTHYFIKNAESVFKFPIAIYALLIGTMVSLAFLTTPQIILGAIMFAISDFYVGKDRFVGRKNWHALAITPLYFGAQALFALSVAQAL